MANAVAYGFYDMRDTFSHYAYQNGALIPQLASAIAASAAEQTRQLNELMSTIVQRVTYPKIRTPIGGVGTLQPIDEWGVPVPVRGGAYYEMGFPIQGGGTAIGTNRVSRAKMTVQMLNDAVVDAQKKDTDWLMRHALAAILDPVSWTYVDTDATVGSLTVKPLANADTDVYPLSGGTTATDTHYLAQAAGIADATNPFPAIFTELNEHPENAGRIVAYLPTNLVATTSALTEHIMPDDPTVTTAINTDTLNGNGADLRRFGTRYFGYLKSSQIHTVEWARLPDNYAIIVAIDAQTPVLAMREHPEPALQGFFSEFHSPDGNKEQTSLLRFAGFGALNRVGAVALRIGSATYTTTPPTGYDAPLGI